MQFKTGINPYYDEWVERGKFIENYEGADIFEYPDILGNPQFTFWYGRSESQYISSIKSIGEARAWIDRNGVQR